MTSILLIDLSSIVHPLFHVSASDPDPNATSIKTVERVRALASGQPHVAVCVEGGKSFRKDLDPTYKSNRPVTDAALQHQMKLAIETLRADGFPVWSAPGYEADDVIGTATRRAMAHVVPNEGDVPPLVTIATADKDLMQLVGSRVTIHSLTSGNVLDAEAVKAKYGVVPDQIVDFLALVGDSSDNIKGAKGIGPKGAAELLKKYGNLDDLYTQLTEHGTQFTPGLATALREFQPRLALTRELIRLKTDAPIPFDEIFKPRVPVDAETFGEDIAEGIEEWMPTLTEDAPVRMTAGEQAAGAGTPPAIPPVPAPPPIVEDVPTNEWATQNTRAVSHLQPKPPDPPLPIAMVPYERQLEPTTLRECYVLAGEMFKSRLFSAYGTPQGVLSTMLAGRELGLSAMASLRAFHIIDGKPTLSADLIRALIMQSGKAEYFRCKERTADHATFVTKRKGDPEIAMTFTIDEAKVAWQKDERAWKASGYGRNPADMCVARCSSKLARLVYADVVFNLYSPEEME